MVLGRVGFGGLGEGGLRGFGGGGAAGVWGGWAWGVLGVVGFVGFGGGVDEVALWPPSPPDRSSAPLASSADGGDDTFL